MAGFNIVNLPSFKNFEADIKKIYTGQEQSLYDLILMALETPSEENKGDEQHSFLKVGNVMNTLAA